MLVLALFFLRSVEGAPWQNHFLTDTVNVTHPLKIAIDSFGLSKIVVSPNDDRFNELRRHANNFRYNSNAAYITLPKSSDDVVAILRFAMANDLRPTVRSGKHCYEDFWSNNSGGILVDMSRMDKIYQVPHDPTIWVESGTLIGRLYDVLFKDYGLTAPVASCFEVGVGGNVLGGGYGVMVRKNGPIIDYVDSIEMAYVTENKSVGLFQVSRNSTNEKDQNLFWALRGAGVQNFGIVTKFGFKDLPESPPLVYQYSMSLTLNEDMNKSMFFDYMANYIKFLVANSSVDNENCDAFISTTVTRNKNTSSVSLTLVIFGDKLYIADNFFGSLGLDQTNATRYKYSYNRYLHESSAYDDTGSYYLQRSAYMVGPMPQHQLESLWTYMTDPEYSYLVGGWVKFNGYGCAVRRFPENATAYPHRTAVVKIQYGTYWYENDNVDKHWNWSRGLYKSMYGDKGPRPDDVMDGCFMNYADGELIDWQHLYFKNNYERLKEVKRQWDPLNIFHHRQSIEI